MSLNRSPGYRNWLMCRSTYGKDHLVDAILDGHVDYSFLAESKNMYEDKLLKSYVEACLLATEDFDDISETLEVDKHVIMLYHDLYYSVHDLSRIRKTQHLSKIEDNNERNLKQWSMTSGMDFIKWRLGLVTDKSAVDNIRQLQADAYFRSKEAFFSSNSTIASSEGLKWSKQAVILTKLLEEMSRDDLEDASDDLGLELDRLTELNINLPGIEDLK